MADRTTGGQRADYVIHRADCASGTHSPVLATDQEALQLLAGPDETLTCAVCKPEALLRHYGA
ncbi:DUF6233 domain-containing protein [Streptomyces sp. CA-181903]|uniref:DUF6233 domain-containing protein n=1 Tax=Streptomyces sp. CA-181903 TaxID=3240055 RepID=UPI003D8C3297